MAIEAVNMRSDGPDIYGDGGRFTVVVPRKRLFRVLFPASAADVRKKRSDTFVIVQRLSKENDENDNPEYVRRVLRRASRGLINNVQSDESTEVLRDLRLIALDAKQPGKDGKGTDPIRCVQTAHRLSVLRLDAETADVSQREPVERAQIRAGLLAEQLHEAMHFIETIAVNAAIDDSQNYPMNNPSAL